MSARKADNAIMFNILIKKDGDLFVAHCLEMDIVAAASTPKQVKEDIIDLIKAQISYAFSNNNLDYLYHPAPPEVWKEFFECRDTVEEKSNRIESGHDSFVPPWMIAKICKSFVPDHA